MKIRPMNDQVLVRYEKPPEKIGHIILPNGGRVLTGTVLAVGAGRKMKNGRRRPMDVAVGDRVAFFRENLEHQTGKQVTQALHELEEDVALIQEDAILFGIPLGVSVTVDA